MSDELNLTPELTLDPSGAAAQAAAAPELTLEPAAAQAAPELTLEPTAPQAPQPDEAAIQAQRDANAVKLDESMLSEAEKKMVDEFAKKIDVTDSNLVLQYGAAAQKNIAAFSENALNSVKTKDLGEVGEALSALVVELKDFGEEEEEKKGIFGFFQKKKKDLEALKASYAKAETNVDKIVRALESHQVVLMKDIAMLDQMYELNTKYYKELTMYIIAGKKASQLSAHQRPGAAQAEGRRLGSQEDAQAYKRLCQPVQSLCRRRFHDLELTRHDLRADGAPKTRLAAK